MGLEAVRSGGEGVADGDVNVDGLAGCVEEAGVDAWVGDFDSLPPVGRSAKGSARGGLMLWYDADLVCRLLDGDVDGVVDVGVGKVAKEAAIENVREKSDG